MFNICFESAKFPTYMKIIRILPESKGRSSRAFNGYIPVEVLPTPANVLESSVYVRETIKGATRFLSSHSIAINLLNFMVQVAHFINASIQVDAVCFDFKEASDTVDNDVLLMKLVKVGFCETLFLKIFCDLYEGQAKIR